MGWGDKIEVYEKVTSNLSVFKVTYRFELPKSAFNSITIRHTYFECIYLTNKDKELLKNNNFSNYFIEDLERKRTLCINDYEVQRLCDLLNLQSNLIKK